jgi:hypothetical protein
VLRPVALVLLLVTACGDAEIGSLRVAGVTGADRLWGASGGFCARTPAGLACWTTGVHGLEPVAVVDGLERVEQVAIQDRGTCALHGGRVSCFRIGDTAATATSLAGVTDLIATDGIGAVTCAAHTAGVWCWQDPDRPTLYEQLGKPRRLLAASDAGTGAVCAVGNDTLDCLPISPRGDTGAVISFPDVHDPRAVILNTTGGDAFVLDGDRALHGTFRGTLELTGNPFASSDPLAVGATIRPLQRSTVALNPIPELGPARALVVRSITPVVLDEQGVVDIDHHNGIFDRRRWPSSATPTALYPGTQYELYTVEAGRLHQRDRRKDEWLDRVVSGVVDPIAIGSSFEWVCILEARGTVRCVHTPHR